MIIYSHSKYLDSNFLCLIRYHTYLKRIKKITGKADKTHNKILGSALQLLWQGKINLNLWRLFIKKHVKLKNIFCFHPSVVSSAIWYDPGYILFQYQNLIYTMTNSNVKKEDSVKCFWQFDGTILIFVTRYIFIH